MPKPIKNKNFSWSDLGLALLVLVSLGAFCYFVNFSLIIPLLLLTLGVHLSYFNKASVRLFVNLGLLLVILLFSADALVKYSDVPAYYIPVACVGMLVILLYNDLQLAFLMSFMASAMIGLLLHHDFNFMLISFVGSLTAVYCVKDARTRSDLIQTGFIVGLVQVFAAVLLNPALDFWMSKKFLMQYFKPLLVNGFIAAAVVMVSSKIFEFLFGVLTNFSLLELSDFNHPLLRRMVVEAPGTYHHSLIVSNLSEAAAESIGAHSLLTRVGAYYHDIGKLIKPEYFTENQLLGANKHEHLEPNMSKLVILNHVKEGLELAKKYRLSPVIAKFIPEHHGTGIIYYFYQRALEGAQPDETIDKETFRYPGPKPQSRETAIVLLADSVEGAVRAIEDPTPARVDEVVRKVVNNKFIDGQLDECNLTLKEIETITTTFIHVLTAMYHSRVKYPEKANDAPNNHKKLSEKNSHNGHASQKRHREDPES